jgi:hypothetical protein
MHSLYKIYNMQKVGYSFTSKYFNAAHNTSQGRSSKYFRQKWRFEEYSCEILLRFLQIVLYSSTTAPLVRIGLYLATIKPFAKDLNHNPLVQSLVLHGNEQLSPCGNHTCSGIPCSPSTTYLGTRGKNEPLFQLDYIIRTLNQMLAK